MVAVTLAVGSSAQASVYERVLHVYQSTGSIPPCEFSSAQLSAALSGVDTYGEQYFADFSDAVQAALAARASGSCARGVRLSTAGVVPAPLRPGSLTAPTDADLPAPMLLMAAIAAIVLAALGAAAIAGAWGWDPPWAARWRHSWAEAAYRIGGGLESLGDRWRARR